MKASRFLVLGLCVAAATCGKSTPASPIVGGATLTAPAASAPADQAQLVTLRPTLTVTNGTSDTAGGKTYEFQVSDKSDFSTTTNTGAFPVLARQTGITESAGDHVVHAGLRPAAGHAPVLARAAGPGHGRIRLVRHQAASTPPSSATTGRASCTIR